MMTNINMRTHLANFFICPYSLLFVQFSGYFPSAISFLIDSTTTGLSSLYVTPNHLSVVSRTDTLALPDLINWSTIVGSRYSLLISPSFCSDKNVRKPLSSSSKKSGVKPHIHGYMACRVTCCLVAVLVIACCTCCSLYNATCFIDTD